MTIFITISIDLKDGQRMNRLKHSAMKKNNQEDLKCLNNSLQVSLKFKKKLIPIEEFKYLLFQK